MEQNSNTKGSIFRYLPRQTLIILGGMAGAGILLFIISIFFLVNFQQKRIENMIQKEIIPNIPPPFKLNYKKARIDLFGMQVVIPEVEIINSLTKENMLSIKKVSVDAVKQEKDPIPAFGKLYLEGITVNEKLLKGMAPSSPQKKVPKEDKRSKAKRSVRKTAFNLPDQKNIPSEEIIKKLLSSTISIYIKYLFEPKNKILHIQRLCLKEGNNTILNISSSFGNIVSGDIFDVFQAKNKDIGMKLLMEKIKLLSIDLSGNLLSNDINIAKLLSTYGAQMGLTKGINKISGLPENLNAMLKLHFSANKAQKEITIRELIISADPGFSISLQLGLGQVNFDNINELSNAELNKFNLKITDNNGINTIFKISAGINKISEDQLKTEFYKNIGMMIQMYGSSKMPGKDIDIVKNFLTSKRNSITLKMQGNRPLKLDQLMGTKPDAIANLLQSHFVLE